MEKKEKQKDLMEQRGVIFGTKFQMILYCNSYIHSERHTSCQEVDSEISAPSGLHPTEGQIVYVNKAGSLCLILNSVRISD